MAEVEYPGGTAYGMPPPCPPSRGETAVVFGATGGVGSILTQLLVNNGVRVLAVAGPANDEWVRSVGAEPVHHGDGLGHRLREGAPNGIDAAYDAFGGGYVELAAGLRAYGGQTLPLDVARRSVAEAKDHVGRGFIVPPYFKPPRNYLRKGKSLLAELDLCLHVDVGVQRVGDVALAVRDIHQVTHPLLRRSRSQNDPRPQHDPGQPNRMIALRHHTLGVVLVGDDVEPGPGGHRQERQ